MNNPADMNNQAISTEARDGVLEVTLNRPKANAIDVHTSREMGRVFAEFRDDAALRVAIITGAGGKFFCAGWDLKAAAAQTEAADADFGVGGFGGLQELADLNKPVIAAVNGIACGGGMEWALSADLIIAAEHASFRAAGEHRRHYRRCRHHQTAQAHPLSHRHGYVVYRALDGGR